MSQLDIGTAAFDTTVDDQHEQPARDIGDSTQRVINRINSALKPFEHEGMHVARHMFPKSIDSWDSVQQSLTALLACVRDSDAAGVNRKVPSLRNLSANLINLKGSLALEKKISGQLIDLPRSVSRTLGIRIRNVLEAVSEWMSEQKLQAVGLGTSTDSVSASARQSALDSRISGSASKEPSP